MSDSKEPLCGFPLMDAGRFDVHALPFFNFLRTESGTVSVALKTNVCRSSICFGRRANAFCLSSSSVSSANASVAPAASRSTLVSFAAPPGRLMRGGCGMF